MRYLGRTITLLLLLGSAGCGDPPTCVLLPSPGVTVHVRDAATGGPLTAPHGLLLVRDGVYADSVYFTGTTASAAYDRPGVYRVEVRAPGYRPLLREGVRVRQRDGGCGLRTVQLDVELSPGT